jgi:hypothetical protein
VYYYYLQGYKEGWKDGKFDLKNAWRRLCNICTLRDCTKYEGLGSKLITFDVQSLNLLPVLTI